MADHTLRRGDAATITVTVVDGNLAALDLTGKTLRFTAKRSVKDAQAAAVLAKVTGSGITHQTQSGATLGKADVAILPADTSGLPAHPTTLVYDVQLTDGTNPYTTETGTLSILPDTTTS